MRLDDAVMNRAEICFPQEARHEIRICERKIAVPAILLRDVQATDRRKLFARSGDAAHLL
jgi:hypothetical protein